MTPKFDSLFPGLQPPDPGGAVNQIRQMYRKPNPQRTSNKNGVLQRLSPIFRRRVYGKKQTNDGVKRPVILLLKHDNPVLFHVGHINLLQFLQHGRTWFQGDAHEVGVQEPSAGVVRVQVRSELLVVKPVIANPVVY